MKRKILVVSMFLFAITIFTLQAQRGYRGNCPEGKMNPNPEVKAYIQQNVLPVMKIQRQELDKQIDAADQIRLDELRAEMKSLMTIIKEKREIFRESEEKPSAEQRAEMRELRNQRHGLMDEVAMLSEKYDAEISSALEPIRENAETWKRELNVIRQESCNNKAMQKQKGQCGRKQYQGADAGMPMQKFLSPQGFLLWDTEDSIPFMDDGNSEENSLQIHIFPNPATETIQVSLALAESGSVLVQVLDKDGQVVIRGSEHKASEGTYSESINLNTLENGVYFVKIKADGKTRVERLIIQK